MSARYQIQAVSPADAPTFALSKPCAGFVASMRGAFSGMLTKLEDSLFELAQVAQGELDRGVYFDAIRELRLGREAIDGRFADRLTACWQALERGEGPVGRQISGYDLDEALALTAAVRRAETDCADSLRAIRNSLMLSVGVPDGDEVIGPRQVYGAFEAAFQDTLTEPSVRRVLVMFFERHVGAVVAGVYRDLEAELERVAETSRQPLAAQQPISAPALDALISDAGSRGDLDINDLLQQALAGGVGDGSEATKLLATLQQHDQPGSRSRSASIDLARVATRQAQGSAGDPSQQIVLDMVALLFDGVFSDSAVPVSARLCIARLQIPFLRLALRDRAMLARRSHLGRRFFERMVAVTRGWQEPPSPQQRQVLEALVDSVGEACLDDHRAFAAAAERGLLDLQTLALPAAETASSRQASRRTLTARAERELAERRHQAGRLPDPVDTFLRTHWLQYLVDCLEMHGAEGSPWRQGLATLDALLWSVSPKEGQAQRRLAELRPRMARRLRQGMDQVGVSMFEQEAFLETLDSILDSAQAGEPVWDWDQESAIDALLGTDEVVAPSADSVSVVEVPKAASQMRLVVPRPQPPEAPLEPAAERAQSVDEDAVSLDDLEADLQFEDIAALDLPGVAVSPTNGDEVDDVAAEAKSAVIDVDAIDASDVADIEPASDWASDHDADIDPYAASDVAPSIPAPPRDEQVKTVAEPGTAQDADRVDADLTDALGDAGEEVRHVAPAVDAAPETPVSALEALLRRRGMSTVAQVEEVVVTERGLRS